MALDSPKRYPIAPENAKSVMVAAGQFVQAVAAIDAVITDREAAYEDAATRPGFPPRPEPDEALLEARAVREATLDQARALRRVRARGARDRV